MAEPTLKDVLDAIALLQKGQTEMRGDIRHLEKETIHRFDIVDNKLDAFRGVHAR